MLDWFSFLFLGAAIVIYCLEIVGTHRSLVDYFTSSAEFGIGKGTILLWAAFFSAWTYIFIFLLSNIFGLGLGILVTILFNVLLYIILSKFVPAVRNEIGRTFGAGLPDVYLKKFPEKGKIAAGIVLLLANLDGLIIQPMLAVWLFGLWFDKGSWLFLALLLAFCTIIAGLGGMAGISRSVKLLLTVSGGALVFLPVYLYGRKGIDQVYDTYQQWAVVQTPELREGILFAVILFAWGLAKISTSIFLWRILISLKDPHYSSSIKLAVAGNGSFSISLLAYFVYISSSNIQSDWLTISHHFTDKQGTLILSLAILIWVISVAHSIIFSLYSLTSLAAAYLHSLQKDRVSIKGVYLISLFLAGISFTASYYLSQYALKGISIYLLYASSIAMPAFVMLLKRRRLPSWTPYILLMIFIASIVSYSLYGLFSYSLYGSLFISVLFGAVLLFSDFSENR